MIPVRRSWSDNANGQLRYGIEDDHPHWAVQERRSLAASPSSGWHRDTGNGDTNNDDLWGLYRPSNLDTGTLPGGPPVAESKALAYW